MIAVGYATCGEIGFDRRTENTAIGSVSLHLMDQLDDALRLHLDL